MSLFKKILFPVDLTEVCRKVVPYVRAVSEAFGSKVEVLFVAHAMKYYENIYVPPVSIRAFEEEVLRGARKKLDEFVEEIRKDLRVDRTEVRFGDAAEEIVRYVSEEDVDLVIMGTHGRKALERILLGSVADYVVKMSRAPVLTVNPFRLPPR